MIITPRTRPWKYPSCVYINYQSTTNILVEIGDKHKVLVFLHSQSLSVQISCQVINLHETQVHSGHSGLFHFKGYQLEVAIISQA